MLLEGDSIKQIGKGQLMLQCSAAVLSPNSFQYCLSGEGEGVSVVSGRCLSVVRMVSVCFHRGNSAKRNEKISIGTIS